MTEHILAVDPGGTTGLCWTSIDRVLGVKGSPVAGGGMPDERYHNLFEYGEVTGDIPEQVGKLSRGVVRLSVRIIICESSDPFLLKGGKSLKKHSLIPVKIAAALHGIVTVSRVPMVYVEQGSGQMKGVIKDEVLEAYGFRPRGRGKLMSTHERDAVKHALLFIRRMYQSWRTPGGFAQTIATELGWDGVLNDERNWDAS
jgi:hypothetical protein